MRWKRLYSPAMAWEPSPHHGAQSHLEMPLSLHHPTHIHSEPCEKAKGQCASHLYTAECYAILFHISAQLLTWSTDKLNKILLYSVTNTNTATLNSGHTAEENVSKAHYHYAKLLRVVVRVLLFSCVLGCIFQKQLWSQQSSLEFATIFAFGKNTPGQLSGCC